MQVALAALADAANSTQNGKLNLLGVFDSIQATEFPATHSSMAFAVRLRAEHRDQQQTHDVRISLIDMDGNELFDADGEVQIGRIQPGGFHSVNMVFNVQSAQFARPGRYRFRIELEGEPEPHDTIFQVRRTESGV